MRSPLLCPLIALLFAMTPVFGDQTGVDLALGLKIHQVADDDLVPDCTCITVDPAGRVVASGPGYIRLLIDQNQDGLFDVGETLVDGPSHGAHGLCFDAADLYFVGDNGVWKVSDTDNDGIVDSPPLRMLEIKTGGEHDAHALRKGPDGHWYLIAGNGTKGMFGLQNVDQAAIAHPRAAITQPRGGAIWRISPDWSQREVWAHGFRNAYDFDFAPDHTIDTFDSDGERDVSLPWYRPTRVFRVRQGNDAGWISRSWKRPNVDPNMPRVLAEFGRGSPTGVLRYRHRRLPKQFHDNVFVLDWTFGRILSVSDDGNVSLVARPTGTTGFAVTDIDALPDGRLVVSVGGRGSRGGLYIIDSIRPLPETPAAGKLWTHRPVPTSDPSVDWLASLRARLEPAIDSAAAAHAIGRLHGDDEPELIAAITLLIESVGGLGPGDPKDARGTEQVAAVFDGYRSRLRPKLNDELLHSATAALLPLLNNPAVSADLRREAIRALAVIEPESKAVFDAIVADLARVSEPTEKLHRLIALARLPVSRSDDMTEQIVAAMIEIPSLIEQRDLNVDRNWTPRLGELFDALARRDSLLPSRLVSHPDFGHPAHLVWTERMDPENLERARQLLLDRSRDAEIDPAVAMFIARGNDAIPRSFLTEWLDDPATESAAWLGIAKNPLPEDVATLQTAALSIDKTVSEKAKQALQKLGAELPQRKSDSQAVQKWLQRSKAILARQGNVASGKQLFVARQCANCHNGAKALGPSLEGISKRFSGEDILRATVDPHQTIADRYRAKQVVTADGNVLIGMTIYESVDGLTLLTAEAKTLRINQADIEIVKDATKSLMPEGLLEGLYNDHVADLLAYLQSL
jgi:putative heme-binding domain-containing protein